MRLSLLPILVAATLAASALAPAPSAQPTRARAFGGSPRPIQSGETLQGTLAGSDPRLGDDSHYDLFAYAGRAGETVVFTMRSSDFDAYLAVGTLQGSDITVEQSDDDSAGGTDAEITVVVGASGAVTVRTNSLSANQTGRYTLQAEAVGRPAGQAKPSAATGTVLRAGETARGNLTASDPTLGDDSHYDLYTYQGEAGDEVVVTLRSSAFDAFLSAGTVSGTTLSIEATDDDSGGGSDARVAMTAGYSGQFTVRVNSYGAGETGAYTLQAERTRGGAVASVATIRAGQTVRGSLDDRDPTLGDDSHYDLYAFAGSPNEQIEVTMTAAGFDAYLGGGASPDDAVRGADHDDDSGGGTNAQLRVQAGPDGRYVVRANSLLASTTGAYTLAVRSLGTGGGGAPVAAGSVLRLGRTVTGDLAASDETLQDGTHFDYYTYEGTPGEEIVVTLESSDFDPYMILNRFFGGELESVAQDDDGGPGLGARVRATLPQSGTYVVVANSVGVSTGRYTLRLDRPEDVADEGGVADARPALRLGEEIRGQLATGDAVLADDSFADVYVFRGEPGDRVSLTLRSAAFDAYLTVSALDGGELTAVGQDDDGGGGTDAQVHVTVGGTGMYAVQANSYGAGATGAYTLVAERASAAPPAGPAPAGPAPAGPPAPGVPSQARFVGKWSPATYVESASYASVRDESRGARRLESIADHLNVNYPLPRNIPVSFDECGQPNAYYQSTGSGEGSVHFCYEMMPYLREVLGERLAPADIPEAVNGAYEFIMLHEVGHALTHQLDLPITGREEDVADQFATLNLLRQGDKGAQSAIYGVLALQGSTEFGESDYADEHSLGPQRYYNVACWIYGSDPEKYSGLVGGDGLPEARAARCPSEFAQMEKSWSRLLGLVYDN